MRVKLVASPSSKKLKINLTYFQLNRGFTMKNSIVRLFAIASLTLVSASAHAQSLFDNYNFENASFAHASAQMMNASRSLELVGSYRMIATASRSYRGEFQKKDMNGIANADQSVLGLQIAAQSTGSLIQVIQLNLGLRNQNQGPAVVVYKNEGTMSFAQFSYKNGQISDEVFFFSECKLLNDRNLLCAKRFMVQDVSAVNPQQAAMNNTIVGYDLYTR
jgi:hypothetical protein